MRAISSLCLAAALLCGLLVTGPLHGRQAPGTSAPSPDPLMAAVTVETRAQPLADLLQGLNTPGRPTLQASGGAQIERLTVFARTRPLRKVMDDLAELLHYTWAKDQVTQPSGASTKYTLAPDLNIRRYEKDLWDRQLERGAEHLFHLTHFLNLSQEECARMDQEVIAGTRHIEDRALRENLFRLSRPGGRISLEMWTTLSPEQRQRLLEDEEYALTDAEMNDRQRALTHRLGLEIGRLRKLVGRDLVEGEKPEDSATVADRFGMMWYAPTNPVSGQVMGFDPGLTCFPAGSGRVAPMSDVLAVRGNPYHYDPARKSAFHPIRPWSGCRSPPCSSCSRAGRIPGAR